MSEINRFIEKMKTDPGLQAKLGELSQEKAELNKINALAEAYGYHIGGEDWAAYAKERLASTGVSNEQLSSVAGGQEDKDAYTCSPWCVMKLLESEGLTTLKPPPMTVSTHC